MKALRLLSGLAGAALLLVALAPSAAAYSCQSAGPNAYLCDVDDNGVPDVYTVFVPGQGSAVAVLYRDAAVASTGLGYTTYGVAGYHSGGAGAGCYDPQQDLDCDYASVYYGSSDVGYLDLQKFGDRVQLCRYGGAVGYGCRALL